MAGNIGPNIPEDIARKLGIKTNRASTSSSSNGSDDEDLVGPSPALAGCSDTQAMSQTIDKLTTRKDKDQDDGSAAGGRGDWMTVPPTSLRNQDKAPLFDKSWTETPEEKRKRLNTKPKEKQETPSTHKKKEEDEAKSQYVAEFNRGQRPKSLMEMHQESLKKNKKGKDRHRERSPKRENRNDDDEEDEWKQNRFDRDRDLKHARQSGGADKRRQREMLNSMAFLKDKYAPSKGGSFM